VRNDDKQEMTALHAAGSVNQPRDKVAPSAALAHPRIPTASGRSRTGTASTPPSRRRHIDVGSGDAMRDGLRPFLMDASPLRSRRMRQQTRRSAALPCRWPRASAAQPRPCKSARAELADRGLRF
jgi:hypothetical protein